MIDFSKLGTSTQAEREAEDQAWVEQQKTLIRTRQQMLVEIAEASKTMDAWSTTFLRDMNRIALAMDPITSLPGGGLTVLSERQLAQLTRLHAAAVR